MNDITHLKTADQLGNFPDVMHWLGRLLDADFERSAKLAVRGGKDVLQGGVFSSRYSNAFWASDLPDRFGKRMAEHAIYRVRFWAVLLKNPIEHLLLLNRLLQESPSSVEQGIRHQRLFLEDVRWTTLRPLLLSTDLRKFAEVCEGLREAQALSEARIATFDPLLKKISLETVVLHFSVWLERRYFEASDDRNFRAKNAEFVEVLESVLNLVIKHQINAISASKSIADIEKTMREVFARLGRDPHHRVGCEGLFEAINHHLDLEHNLEMFCSYSWNVRFGESGFTTTPSDPAQAEAWLTHQEKFHAMDSFEIWCPESQSEHTYMREIYAGATNRVSADTFWQIYTAQRFLAKHCGNDVIEKAEQKLGFTIEEALKILLCNRACYEETFIKPRINAKRSGGDFRDSFGLNPSREMFVKMLAGESTLLTRQPFEPRSSEVFTEIAATFELTASIPVERIRKIYTHFAHSLESSNAKLSDKLFFRNRHCDLLVPRIFTSDVKTQLFNDLFAEQYFEKQISEILERRIETIFEWRGFKTLLGRKLGQGGRDGEADVLAYRDGTLFVIEAKCTRFRARASEVEPVQEKLTEGAAQLHRLLASLPQYWLQMHADLEAPTNWEQLRVIPLLVSNSLEFDHLYFDDILKISDFELEMIFRNNPIAIWSMSDYHRTQFVASPDNVNLGTEHSHTPSVDDIEKFALYPAELEPSVDELISCLEESRFWTKVFGRPIELTRLSIY